MSIWAVIFEQIFSFLQQPVYKMACAGQFASEISCSDSGKIVLGFLRSAYRDKVLCDVNVQTGDGIISAHRVIMAAYSEKLKSAFSKQNGESTHALLDLTAFPKLSILQIIDSLYSGDLVLNDNNIAGIIITSKHLGTRHITEGCRNYLSHYTTEKALAFYEICIKCREEPLAQEIWNWACEHFEEIWRTDSFKKTSVTNVQGLLADDKLQVASELHVLDAAVRWVEAERGTRESYLKDLLACCRFPLMDPEDIITKVEKHPYLSRLPDSHRLLYSALCYHSLSARHSPMAEKFAAKPRRRLADSSYSTSTGTSLSNVGV